MWRVVFYSLTSTLVPPLERFPGHSSWTIHGQPLLWDIAQAIPSLQHFPGNPRLHHLWKSRALCKNWLDISLYTLCFLHPISSMKIGTMSCHIVFLARPGLTLNCWFFQISSPQKRPLGPPLVLFSPSWTFFFGMPASFFWLMRLQKVEHNLGVRPDLLLNLLCDLVQVNHYYFLHALEQVSHSPSTTVEQSSQDHSENGRGKKILNRGSFSFFLL